MKPRWTKKQHLVDPGECCFDLRQESIAESNDSFLIPNGCVVHFYRTTAQHLSHDNNPSSGPARGEAPSLPAPCRGRAAGDQPDRLRPPVSSGRLILWTAHDCFLGSESKRVIVRTCGFQAGFTRSLGPSSRSTNLVAPVEA